MNEKINELPEILTDPEWRVLVQKGLIHEEAIGRYRAYQAFCRLKKEGVDKEYILSEINSMGTIYKDWKSLRSAMSTLALGYNKGGISNG